MVVILNEVKNLSCKHRTPGKADSSFALLRTSASLRMTDEVCVRRMMALPSCRRKLSAN